MAHLIRNHLCIFLALPVVAAAQGFTGTVDLSAVDAGVTRHLAISHWRVDKRGVPSFDYRYRQDGPGCAYEREGHAIAGFDDNGDSVELEVHNPQGADGKEGAPIAAFYDEPNGVVFGMPVRGQGARFWVSFDDPHMKKTLPAKCGSSALGTVLLRK
jgi:hypothetical protein